jgi:hypothetical protein
VDVFVCRRPALQIRRTFPFSVSGPCLAHLWLHRGDLCAILVPAAGIFGSVALCGTRRHCSLCRISHTAVLVVLALRQTWHCPHVCCCDRLFACRINVDSWNSRPHFLRDSMHHSSFCTHCSEQQLATTSPRYVSREYLSPRPPAVWVVADSSSLNCYSSA